MPNELPAKNDLLEKLNDAAKNLAPVFGAVHARVILCYADGTVIEGGTSPVPSEVLYQALMQAATYATELALADRMDKYKPHLNS